MLWLDVPMNPRSGRAVKRNSRLIVRLRPADFNVEMGAAGFLAYPVVRVGRLCDLDRDLTRAESNDIVAWLKAEWSTIRPDIEATWKATIGNGKVHCKWENKPPRIEQDNFGHIVRFPHLEISAGKFVFRSSSSVAPCEGPQRSKVWASLVMTRSAGGGAKALSRQSVSNFIEQATGSCRQAGRPISEWYKKALSAVGVRTKLRLSFDLEIVTVGSSDPRLREVLRKLQTDSDVAIDDILESADSKLALADFLKLTKLKLRNGRSQQQANSDWQLHDLRKYCALYYARCYKDRVRYSGIVPVTRRQLFSPSSPPVEANQLLARRIAPDY